MNQEAHREEDGFVGEIQGQKPESGKGVSMEQRVEWFEARNLLQERLKDVDPALEVEFDEEGFNVGVLDAMLIGSKKAPGLFVKHGKLYLLSIQGPMLHPKDVGLERFKKDLDRNVEIVRKRLAKLASAEGLKPPKAD